MSTILSVATILWQIDISVTIQCYGGSVMHPKISNPWFKSEPKAVECKGNCSTYGAAAYGRIYTFHGCSCEPMKTLIEKGLGDAVLLPSMTFISSCYKCTGCSSDLCNEPTQDSQRDNTKCNQILIEKTRDADLSEEETEAFLAYVRNPTDGMDLESTTLDCYNSSYMEQPAVERTKSVEKVKCDGKCTKFGYSAFGSITDTMHCVPHNVQYCKMMKRKSFMRSYADCFECKECNSTGCNSHETNNNKRPHQCLPMLETMKRIAKQYQNGNSNKIDREMEELKRKYLYTSFSLQHVMGKSWLIIASALF